MKKKSAPVKITKKKAAPPPVPESEFDNMTDMFGTSPFVKRAEAPVPKKTFERSPVKAAAIKRTVEKSPVKQWAKKETSVLQQEVQRKAEQPKPELVRPPTDLGLEARFEELQRRFEQLNMLRTTNAESLLDNYRKTVETRDYGIHFVSIFVIKICLAAEKLIESLRNENALLKERLEAQNKSRRESGISVSSVASNGNSLVTSIQFPTLFLLLNGTL